MRILVLSDIHGNLPALEFVLNREQFVDLMISLGDVVNYGPWSNECVDLLDSLKNKILLSGNHEEAFITGQYAGENIVANAFFEACYPEFNRGNKIIHYIRNCSYLNCLFTHTINNSYVYSDTDIQIESDTFLGHSHRLFTKRINGQRLVNVGSVGQNRTNIDELNYVIWDTDNNTVDLVRRTFKVDMLLNEMKIKNYPEICINYLLSKRK